MSIYRRVLKYYRGFLTRSLVALAFSFAAIGLNLLKPWPFKIIVDEILKDHGDFVQFGFRWWFGGHVTTPAFNAAEAIALLCLAMVVIQLLWSLLNLASNYIFVKIGLESLLRLRTELYAHLQRLYADLKVSLRRYQVSLIGLPQQPERSQAEHEAIAIALERGDLDRAVAEVHSHITNLKERLLKRMTDP